MPSNNLKMNAIKMDSRKRRFNPNKLLPQNLIINSIDLYEIGLSLFINEDIHRKNIHNPKFMFIIQLQLFIRQCMSLSISEGNPNFSYISEILDILSKLEFISQSPPLSLCFSGLSHKYSII